MECCLPMSVGCIKQILFAWYISEMDKIDRDGTHIVAIEVEEASLDHFTGFNLSSLLFC